MCVCVCVYKCIYIFFFNKVKDDFSKQKKNPEVTNVVIC